MNINYNTQRLSNSTTFGSIEYKCLKSVADEIPDTTKFLKVVKELKKDLFQYSNTVEKRGFFRKKEFDVHLIDGKTRKDEKDLYNILKKIFNVKRTSFADEFNHETFTKLDKKGLLEKPYFDEK
ncbi:MAG: hypothetical protein PHV68_07310 [Candidatus Gastranaerophilales bacterium]|nr:hypothetical protein [Candidatus Gastranaerophilales bacterium]